MLQIRIDNRTRAALALSGLLLALVACGDREEPAEEYDLILAGGTIVDGTGNDRYTADIGIRGEHIVSIGALDSSQTEEILRIDDLVVSPGFIDTHSHADQALRTEATAGIEGFLRQGVTTAVYGVDGYASLADLKANIDASEMHIMGVNFMSYIGHNGVRRAAMGEENRRPTNQELDQMRADVKAAMKLGAIGLSSGLMYIPGIYASTEEVIELAKIVAPYEGKYDSHIRDPANRWVESITECIDIAREAGIDAHVAHIKAVGAKNFGKSQGVIDLINARIDAGENITADVYPYDGASTRRVMAIIYPANDAEGISLFQRLSRAAAEGAHVDPDPEELVRLLREYWRHLDTNSDRYIAARANTEEPPEGVFSWVETVGYQSMRIVVSANPDYEGRMVTELAEALGITPFELFRRLVAEEGAGAMVTLGAIQENEVRGLMKQPWAMISSDGAEIAVEHPRGRGSFPRVVGRYVREWGVFTLEEAVHKITGAPAAYLELTDRGVIREGAIADLAIFDPDMVIDNATWTKPTLYSVGVEHVLIGGDFALRDGELTPSRLGQYIPFMPVAKENQ